MPLTKKFSHFAITKPTNLPPSVLSTYFTFLFCFIGSSVSAPNIQPLHWCLRSHPAYLFTDPNTGVILCLLSTVFLIHHLIIIHMIQKCIILSHL